MKLEKAYERIRIFGLEHEHNYRQKLGITTEFYDFSEALQFKNFADGKYYQPEIVSPETGERIGNKRVNKCYPGFKANPQTLTCEPQRDESAPEPQTSIFRPESIFKKMGGRSDATSPAVTSTAEDLPDTTIKRIDITSWEAVKTPGARKSMFDRILELDGKEQLKAALEVTSTLEEAKEFIKARQREADSPNERSVKIKNDFAYQGKSLKWYAHDRGSDISPQHLFTVQKFWGEPKLFPDNIYFITKDKFVIDKLNGSLIYRGVMDSDGKPKYRDEQGVLRSDDQYNACPIDKQKTKDFANEELKSSRSKLKKIKSLRQKAEPRVENLLNKIEGCKTKVTHEEANENIKTPLPDSPNNIDPITQTTEYIKAREIESRSLYPERIETKKNLYAERLEGLPEKEKLDEIRKIRSNDKGFNITYYHYDELTEYFGATSFKEGKFIFKTKDNKYIKYSANEKGAKTFQYITKIPENTNIISEVKSSDLKPASKLREIFNTMVGKLGVIKNLFPPTESDSKLEIFKKARQTGLDAFSNIERVKDTDSLINFIEEMKSKGIRIRRNVDKNGVLKYKFYYPLTSESLLEHSDALDESDLFQVLKEKELNRYSEYSLTSKDSNNREANRQFEATYKKIQDLFESETNPEKKEELKKQIDYFLSRSTRGVSSKLTDILVEKNVDKIYDSYTLPSEKNVEGAYISNLEEVSKRIKYLDRLEEFASKQSYGELLDALETLKESIKSESEWNELGSKWGELFASLEKVGLEGSISNLAEVAALQYLLKSGKESEVFVPKDTNFPAYDLLSENKLYPVKYKKGIDAGTTALNRLYKEKYISTIKIDPKNFDPTSNIGKNKEDAVSYLKNSISKLNSTNGINLTKLKENKDSISMEFNALIDEKNTDNLFETLLQTGYIKLNKNNEYEMISPLFLGHALFAIASINEQKDKNPTQLNVDINKENSLEIKETPVTKDNLRFRLRTDRSKGLRYTISKSNQLEDAAEKLVEEAKVAEAPTEILQKADNLIKPV